MDSAQFTSQLTQFTSIESLNKINTTLTDIKSIQSSIDSAQAIGFVGKTIKANGNKIYLQESDTQNQADINFNLESSASNIAIGVYNASGDYVKTVYASGLSAGSNNVKWDKTDDSGKKVANGVYTFEITAVNQNNEKVNASPITSGKVTGLKFKDGLAYLLIGTQEVLSSDVIQVDDN